MKLDFTRAGALVESFELRKLFIDELGWDRNPNSESVLEVDDSWIAVEPLAEKRGVQVLRCTSEDGAFPDYRTRQIVERKIRQMAHEHLIIFTDARQTRQTWQWVAREPGRPTAYREYTYHKGQSPQAILERLEPITFWLSDEEGLTISGVTTPLKSAFDKDVVTKKFYERFKTEHSAFLEALEGLAKDDDREWYASVMLNRLMFVYFIQKKGFLDGDLDYLRNKLEALHSDPVGHTFLSFYRRFLLRLFHEGLGSEERGSDLDELVGDVPYLNGGLFDVHVLEAQNPDIDIPDTAFERLFDFFDAYQWHLDERPISSGNEVNPDVLGYIFEKYINQKQMGAYYTQEDITGYISASTLLPYLEERVTASLGRTSGQSPLMLDRLSAEPERYIFAAMKHGVIAHDGEVLEAPEAIVLGEQDVEYRCQHWDDPALPEQGLPTETWREYHLRRQQCLAQREALASGSVSSLDDAVALNLDIGQWVQDSVDHATDPDLVLALYRAACGTTVLDPTCGSGAFLFAALNVLEPIYEACLARMAAFVAEDTPQHDSRPEFTSILAETHAHASQRYGILKRIIVNNLFGADIMEEAVEICRLRLFLKLVSQVDQREKLEPLPDIDFNVVAGNTLVGFASRGEVEAGLASRLDLDDTAGAIESAASSLDRALEEFRALQGSSTSTGTVLHEAKAGLLGELSRVRPMLDSLAAREYGINPADEEAVDEWRSTYQPLHWFIEFHETMAAQGGFAVVIGNPPYVETRTIDYTPRGYATAETGNLYALVMERSLRLCSPDGRLGFIVPVSSISTPGYVELQRCLPEGGLFSSYDDRPSRLFEGLEHCRLTIHLLKKGGTPDRWATEYRCWNSEERDRLFETLRYTQVDPSPMEGSIPKIGTHLEREILGKLWADGRTIAHSASRHGAHEVYYSRKVGHFLQALDFVPQIYDENGELLRPTELKTLRLESHDEAAVVFCALNSSLFRWFFSAHSDCRNLNKRDVEGFPLDVGRAALDTPEKWQALAERLAERLRDTSEMRDMRFKYGTRSVQCIIARHAKPIVDEVDRELCRHYKLDDGALDFIRSWRSKYRSPAPTPTTR